MSNLCEGNAKKTIGVVVLDRFYERSFLSSGVLKEMSMVYNLVLIKDRRIIPDSADEGIFSHVFDFNSEQILSKRTSKFLSEVLRWRYRSRSISFGYRESRYRSSLPQALKARKAALKRETARGFQKNTDSAKQTMPTSHLLHNSFLKKNFARIRWVFMLITKKYVARMFAYNPLFQILCVVDRPNTIKSAELESVLVRSNAELVLVPTGGMQVTDREIVNIARKNKIKTFYLFDNWDNLSSKTILWNRPDFVATWGPQTSLHAIQIQGFNAEQIFELGSARFSNYKRIKTAKPSSFPTQYVLFLGVQQDYDEIRALQRLEDEIVSHPNIYGDLFVVYRPYPGGHQIEDFNQSLFSRIIIDTQLLAPKVKEDSLQVKYTDLNYYPSIIKDALFVVGGFTTMLLESSFFNKVYLAPGYEEIGNLTSPLAVRSNYEHLKEIDLLPNLVVCKDIKELAGIFRKCYEGDYKFTAREINTSLSYFVNPDLEMYGTRLTNAVNEIVSKGE
jgi:hypothetical protein